MTTDLLNERQKTHGNYGEVAGIAQMFREIMRGTTGWQRMNDAQREALDSMASKFGRLGSGDPHFRDHWDDLAGYAALASSQCDSSIRTVEQDIAKVVEQIKVGGEPTGVDEDGEKFPDIVSKFKIDPAKMPQVSKKKGFFSKKTVYGNDDDEEKSLEQEIEEAYQLALEKND